MGIFSEIFSWWGGNTWSNRIYTRLRGKLVGTDGMGNRYYVQSKGIGPLGVPRRWVIYRNLAEASQIPPEWHGWMHYMVDTPPTEEDYTAAALAEGAPHEHDGHAPGLPAARQHPGQRQAPQGDGRLQALAAVGRGGQDGPVTSRSGVTLAPRFSHARGSGERTGDCGSHERTLA